MTTTTHKSYNDITRVGYAGVRKALPPSPGHPQLLLLLHRRGLCVPYRLQHVDREKSITITRAIKSLNVYAFIGIGPPPLLLLVLLFL